jgi:uncharacterized protein (DUF2132 family)
MVDDSTRNGLVEVTLEQILEALRASAWEQLEKRVAALEEKHPSIQKGESA